MDSKNEGGIAQTYTPDAYNAPSYASAPSAAAPKFEDIKTDDDLPF